ncbi:MAG: ABC transporter substrate-binding protein [Actinomycetota bacterium]|nr:ABC transporter substrate-binding protein [Actinomycetota bacterium]
MSRRRAVGLTMVAVVLAAACSGDDATIGSPAPTTIANVGTDSVPGDSVPPALDVEAGKPFPADRCEANKAAGTITYLSSFDFAASASIVDVLVAESKGYFDELCLDVELTASFSVQNYPLIAANDAQFSSGGSFSEMVDFAGANDAGFVALAVEGRTGIDALITKDGEVPTIADVEGTTIGVKGELTPSVRAMLAAQGFVAEEDYTTVLLEGFDPLVHIEVPDIVGFPGYKSNEPLQLEAADVPFKLYDPSEFGIPGSFGVLYTNLTFLQEHPTAAQDFMRASMRGLADAIDDPEAAAQIAVDAINANGNALFLSPEGEIARWGVESQLVGETATPETPLGLPLMDLLTDEVTAYAAVGLFGGVVPVIESMVDASVLDGVYADDGTLIWPAE